MKEEINEVMETVKVSQRAAVALLAMTGKIMDWDQQLRAMSSLPERYTEEELISSDLPPRM